MTRHRRDGRLPARLAATRARSRGFTLIEVVVALTITGFLLGGLFTLVGGSKRLSWRAEAALGKSLQQRAAWNFALLDNDYADLEPILSYSGGDDYEVVPHDELDAPDRQTQPLQYTLQAVDLVSPAGDTEAVALRRIRLQPGVSLR